MPQSRHCSRARRAGYILLETVVATGMLIVGLAVIGAQLQGSVTSVRTMGVRTRAIMLADVQLAELSLGLIEFDSMDEEQEGDFGSRHPDFGWRLTVDETAVADLFQLTLEILYQPREGVEEDFNYDQASVVQTVRTLRVAPRPLDLGVAFGIPEEEFAELSENLSALGIVGVDAEAFDPTMLAKLPFEELVEVLPLLLDAFKIDLGQLTSQIPPDILKMIEGSGLLGGEEGAQEESGGR